MCCRQVPLDRSLGPPVPARGAKQACSIAWANGERESVALNWGKRSAVLTCDHSKRLAALVAEKMYGMNWDLAILG